ncbi:MAG: hypothetical protein KF828_09095 [Anaerolineales bacterium]|nr:hypothetical protein [Anaerolineales bacterium]
MSAIQNLLEDIFGGQQSSLRSEFEGWLRSSRRFYTFAYEYRNKIRAKVHNAQHPGSREDLRAELELAATLSAQPSFAVEYERFAARKTRGPDFSVRFKSHTEFHIEVRRVQAQAPRLAQIVAEKARQLPSGAINLLWLASEYPLSVEEIAASLQTLRQLSAQAAPEDAVLGYRNPAALRKQLPRLSAILVWQAGQATLWPQPAARHSVPPELANSLRRL